MLNRTYISVFVEGESGWSPITGDSRWLLAKLQSQNETLILTLEDESIPESRPLLSNTITQTSEFAFASPDFLEYISSGENVRYGFYFESPDVASGFVGAVGLGLLEIDRRKSQVFKPPPPPPKHTKTKSDGDAYGSPPRSSSPPPLVQKASSQPSISSPTTTTDTEPTSPPPHGKLSGGDNAISTPSQVKSVLRVVFNADLSRFEGLPAEWKSHNKQFGINIENLQKRKVEGYRDGIPTVLDMMKRHFIENKGINVVGVFRLAPDSEVCSTIKAQINSGTYEGTDDVNVLANLIKVFFRELPTCLFSGISDDNIIRVAGMSHQEVASQLSSIVVGKYSSLIFWLLDLMAEVVMNEDVNRMSAKNMAIVMSPNLFTFSNADPMESLKLAQKVAEFTTKLLYARLKTKFNYDARL